MTQSPLLARQCILDRDLNVTAYELLFRGGTNSNEAVISNGDIASSAVLLNAFSELDINQVIGAHQAYVNFTRNLIIDPPPFDRRRFVIEVLEDVHIDDLLINQLRRLSHDGYTIALDDFVYQESLAPLVEVAHIVKIDVLEQSEQAVIEQVNALSRFDVRLLAEKVEDHDCYIRCRELGFEMFQGYFFARPQCLSGRSHQADRQAVMTLLMELQRPDADAGRLTDVISRDPILMYKVIKLANSAYYRRAVEITSVRTAIGMLGLNMVRSFASLLAMTEMADKPHELTAMTIGRAHTCQVLGERIGDESRDTYFTVGMLSTMDAYFDQPLTELLENLPVTPAIREAILSHQGNPGLILDSVTAYQEARWSDIRWAELATLGVESDDLSHAYLAGIDYAKENDSAMGIAA